MSEEIDGYSNETTDHVDEERAHSQQQYNTCQQLIPSRECIDSQSSECLYSECNVSGTSFIESF